MIDYIKIMNLIISFIRSTAIPVDLDNLLNSTDIKIPIMNQIMISKDTLDAIINFSITILIFVLAGSIVYGFTTVCSENDKQIDNKNATNKNMHIFCSGIIFMLSIALFIPLWIFNEHIDNKYDEIRKSIKSNYYTETVPSFQLKTANSLPNGTMTKEDILSFDDFCHNKPNDTTPYDRGNLYTLPLSTVLKETNVQSIKNLYNNINFLDDYYDNNYINDDRYHWINVQLNAFYNSNLTDNTNADILRNLKN